LQSQERNHPGSNKDKINIQVKKTEEVAKLLKMECSFHKKLSITDSFAFKD